MGKLEQIKLQIKAAMYVFEHNEGAEAELIKLLIGLFLVAIIGGNLLPTGIDSLIAGSNSTGTWTASETSTYDAIVIILIVVVIAALAGLAYKAIG